MSGMDDIDQYYQRKALLSASAANDVTPDDAAGAIKSAPWTGLPPSVTMHAPGYYQPLVDTQQTNEIISQSPPVASFVGASPLNAAIAKDDLGPLAQVGHLVDAYTNSWQYAKQALGKIQDDYKAGRAAVLEPAKDYGLMDMIPGLSPPDRVGARMLLHAGQLAVGAGLDIDPPLRWAEQAAGKVMHGVAGGIVDTLGTGTELPSVDFSKIGQKGFIQPGRPATRESAIRLYEDAINIALMAAGGAVPKPNYLRLGAPPLAPSRYLPAPDPSTVMPPVK